MGDFKNTAIKRHESLVPFSRDHYGGLVQAQHLTKAAQTDAVARRKVIAEFVDAWDGEIAQHFDDEERLLMDLMQEPDRDKLRSDHEQIRRDAELVRQLRREVDPDPALLHRIGQRLEQHIRWEERQLFAHLQDELTDEQLVQLQSQTEVIEASRKRKPKNVS